MNKLLKKIGAVALIALFFTSLGLAQNNVTFQVNMNVQEYLGNFNPIVGDVVVIRGSFNGWSGNANLCELQDTIYVCTVNLPNSYVNTTIEYKFVIVPAAGGDVWEGIPNRTYLVPAGNSTIPEVYFNNAGWNFTNVEVLFRVDMQVQILNGNFDPDNDWVVVRGNTNELGNWGGATQLTLETGSTSIYSNWIQFDNLTIGFLVEYKFVILDNGNPDLPTWEMGDNRTLSATGNEPDNLPPPDGNGYGEIMPDLVYFSNVGPEDIITQDVMVNFNVDVRPAFYKMMAGYYIIDVQTGDTLESIDEVDVAGFFNGWPWGSFAPDYIAHDDGVGPDSVAGDTVYAADIQFYAGDPIVLEYKYGLNGYDVEAGFAENHFVNIDDSSPIFVIWPPDIFGSQGDLYDPWIYVREIPRPYMPENFTLHQNYPNPFNPVTQIMFDLPVAGKVTLKVFNVKGEEVYRTTTARLDPGFYSFKFDGTNLASGVYIYQVTTEGFAASKKMMLLK